MIGWTPEQVEKRNEQYRRQEISNLIEKKYRLEALDDSGWGFKMLGRDYDELVAVGEKWVAGKFCADYKISEISS